MKRYLLIQLKRFCRALPFVLLSAIILFGALGGIYSGALYSKEGSQEQNPFRIALVGTGEDAILQMGILALESMDSSQFAFQVIQMEEADAHHALKSGEIAAYVVFPDGFMDNAMAGKILPLRFVSPVQASNIVSILRIELTRVITDVLDAAQKGTYGAASAMQQMGGVRNPWPLAQELALEYTQLILLRGDIYEAEVLGLSDGLDLSGYLLCGLCVLLLLLCMLPFAFVMIRSDRSLNRLLSAKGIGGVKQVICEQLVLFCGYFIVMGAVLMALFSLCGSYFRTDFTGFDLVSLLPVIFCFVSVSFFLYEISSDLLSGILLQFFLFVFMCFVSGCFYPGYFFPEAVQHIGNFLPTGLARMHLAGYLTGKDLLLSGLALALWGGGFTLLSAFARCKALKTGEVGV